MLLDLLACDVLRVVNADVDPQLIKNGRLLVPELVRQRGRFRIADSVARYAWRIHWQGSRRRIVRAKLVYMAVHGVILPPDWQVHHKDENRLNDAIGNLEAKHIDDHKGVHYDQEY